MNEAQGELHPEQRLMRLLGGKWITAAISAAARLGVADALAEKSRNVQELADELSCDSEALYRLIRVLIGEELIVEETDGSLHLTEFGRSLRSDELGSIAEYVGAEFLWNPWSHLSEAVRTGESVFEQMNGKPLFDWLDENPESAELYHRGVDAYSKKQAKALMDAADFSEVGSVVDVGGGRGTLLLEIMNRHPNIHGVLQDLPSTVDAAEARFEANDLMERTTFEGADFFEEIPRGHDVYVLKHILHNWSEEDALKLLRNVREAMRSDSLLYVVDSFILPGNRKDAARMMDLEMLVLFGRAGERTKPQFRKLFHDSGFRLTRTSDLAGMSWLIVGEPK
jgi:ubiquinone/menaquinone biosynthesis C-methylase UbiE